jgi:hypothetical protein
MALIANCDVGMTASIAACSERLGADEDRARELFGQRLAGRPGICGLTHGAAPQLAIAEGVSRDWSDVRY